MGSINLTSDGGVISLNTNEITISNLGDDIDANVLKINDEGVTINDEHIATENYVNNLVKGGVHFRGVYDRLPDELTDMLDEDGTEIDAETKQIGRWFKYEEGEEGGHEELVIDTEVILYAGDIIIVSPNMLEGDTADENVPEEPTTEYILTYAAGAFDEWKWVELGDVTPAQDMIDESLENYYAKSEIDTKIDNIEEVTSIALNDLNNKISTVDDIMKVRAFEEIEISQANG
jgi:hypothetical protein